MIYPLKAKLANFLTESKFNSNNKRAILYIVIDTTKQGFVNTNNNILQEDFFENDNLMSG